MPATATVLYPIDHKFDLDYYLNTHMPLVAKTWTPEGLTSWKVLQFKAPGSIYQIQCTLEFTSAEAVQGAMASAGAPQIMGDIPNFTDAQPVIVAGEVVGSS